MKECKWFVGFLGWHFCQKTYQLGSSGYTNPAEIFFPGVPEWRAFSAHLVGLSSFGLRQAVEAAAVETEMLLSILPLAARLKIRLD